METAHLLCYDKPLSKSITDDVLEKLQDAGFTPVVLTSDLGSSNLSLWKKIYVGTGPDQDCFLLICLMNH